MTNYEKAQQLKERYLKEENEDQYLKVVINNCYGGYCLSKKAYEYLGLGWDGYGYNYSENRSNPELVKCIEELGEEASGSCADLIIETIYMDELNELYLLDYDGNESISINGGEWDTKLIKVI
jgi:hypothetical protein